jgi:hypothetical protein
MAYDTVPEVAEFGDISKRCRSLNCTGGNHAVVNADNHVMVEDDWYAITELDHKDIQKTKTMDH